MRTSDLFLGLVAATLGFGAVVLVAAGAEGWLASLPAIAGGVFLLLMAASATSAATVAVIGRRARIVDLDEELDHLGYAIRSCPGLIDGTCAFIERGVCTIRTPVDVAVVDLAPGAVAVPPCRKGLGAPIVTIEAADGSATGGRAAAARVRAEDGPAAAARAAVRVLAKRG